MGNLSLFLKKNKKEKKNGYYAATKSLCDDNGKPLEWEIKALTTRETDAIREECSKDVPVSGRQGQWRRKIDSTMLCRKLLVAATVFPDMHNAELQDSYGVKTAEDLVAAMVDNPEEYNNFVEFVQEFSGFESMDDKIAEAKN